MNPGDALTCQICGHAWTQKAKYTPRACPKCKTIRWSEHRYKYRSTRQNGFSKEHFTRAEFYAANPPKEKSCPHCGHEWVSRISYRHKDEHYTRPDYCPQCRANLDPNWVPTPRSPRKSHSAVPQSRHVNPDHLTWCEKFNRGATC